MSTNTAQKLQHELNSLQGLSIINLVCGALAMAFGVTFLMPNLISMATTMTFELYQIGQVILGGLAFVVAIRWLTSTAEIIDFASELKESLSKHKKDKTLDDEALTGLIVKLTAAYRENKSALRLMISISKIASVLFALAAILALANMLIGIVSGVALWTALMHLANVGICFGMSAACFIIPHFFGKYSMVWDKRLKEATEAEQELEAQLGAP
jgi:hypothetical protein